MPAYVVLSASDYARLTKSQRKDSLADFLRADQPDDYELPANPFEFDGATF